MKIFCIGRNYRDHAKELNNPVPSQPMVFGKFPTALLKDGKPFHYPEFSQEVHHELELVLKVKTHGKHIDPKFARKYYEEISVGIDFTARDVQAKLKAKGHPWEIAKGFNGSAPCGEFIPIDSLPNREEINFELKNNAKVVQTGNSKDMIFGFDTLIAHISKYFLLSKGDLIYTGTPAGVAEVQIGDVLTATIEGEQLMRCKIL